jgi:putative flippase GtrA
VHIDVFSQAHGRSHTPLRAARARVISSRPLTFASIGVVCTLAYTVLFALLVQVVPPLAANAAALLTTMSVNFSANRWLTFRDATGRLRFHVAGYCLAYLVGLAASSAVLHLLLVSVPHETTAATTGLGLTSGAAATAVRYVLLSAWVFRARGGAPLPLPR